MNKNWKLFKKSLLDVRKAMIPQSRKKTTLAKITSRFSGEEKAAIRNKEAIYNK